MRTATARPSAPLVALVAATLSACAAKPSSPTPPQVPRPPAPAADLPLTAANAGATYVFHVSLTNGDRPRLSEIDEIGGLLDPYFGIEVADGRRLAQLGADPTRPIVVSWAIVEAAALRALLASPGPPARDAPFLIRFRLVLPVADVAGTAALLKKMRLDPSCTRADGEPERWAELLSRLTTPDDRRAAEDRTFVYVCRGDVTAVVVRLDAQRRELSWVAAFGAGSLLAAAAAPLPVDTALATRLQRDGFFAAHRSLYTTPVDEARAYAALRLAKMRPGLGGIPEEEMRALWREIVLEAGGFSRLAESEPRLFADMLATDRGVAWTLTAAGRTFFSSLGLVPGVDGAGLKRMVAQRLKPVGLLADREALVRTFDECGAGAFVLVQHFLWPHILAFTAAHPGEAPLDDFRWPNEGERVELDTGVGVLRLHWSGTK